MKKKQTYTTGQPRQALGKLANAKTLRQNDVYDPAPWNGVPIIKWSLHSTFEIGLL